MPIRRDWLAKSLAGAVLGGTLALGASGLFVQAATGLDPGIRAQLAMWLVVPVWMAALALAFLWRDGWRAWLWLGLANGLAWGVWALGAPP